MRSLAVIVGGSALLFAAAAGAYSDASGTITNFHVSYSPLFGPKSCAGDCNSDRRVTIDEVTRGIAAAQRSEADTSCGYPVQVGIDQLMHAVSNALGGCSLP